MPYCPKCKNEYIEGIHVCPDCQVPLIDDPEDMEDLAVLTDFSEKPDPKLIDFLEYSGVHPVVVKGIDKGNYRIMVPQNSLEFAGKCFRIYLSENEESSEEISSREAASSLDFPRASRTYVSSSSKYEDLKSSSSSFFIVGIIMAVFLILGLTGILPLPFHGSSGILMYGVLGIICIIFIYVGIQSHIGAVKVKKQILSEEEQTQTILQWFLSTYRPSQLDAAIEAADPAGLSASQMSDELLCLKRMELISEYIKREFSLTDDAYVDMLCDEIFQQLYEQK